MSHLPLPSPILSKVAAQAFDIVESLIPDSWRDPAHSRYVANLQSSLADFCAEAWHIVEPQTPLSWNWHLTELCRVLEAVTRGDIGYDRVIINIPPGSMKALDVDTPVLTTWGWKRHGDLAPGDYVFGPDGRPRRVQAATHHKLEPARLLTFDDGVSLVAGYGHLWEVERDHLETPRVRRSVTVSTSELRTGSRPDAIRLCDPILLPPRRLLIDPYLLGAWLGDGASGSGCVYAGEKDVAHFSYLGTVSSLSAPRPGYQRFYRITVPELQTKLRVLGLLHNKHIPEDYLESSVDQRYALLQGLMDTDGTCAEGGSCSLTTGSPILAESFCGLVASLGMKAYRTQRYTTLNGKKYGPHYKITFAARGDQPVFRLKRKQDRVKPVSTDRYRRRYLKSSEDIGERWVSCIQVEGGIYLAGHDLVRTHNSLLTGVMFPAWEWARDPGLRYLTFSYSDVNTIRDNRRMRDIVTSDWYRKHFPHVVIASDQAGKVRFDNTAKGYRIASSVGGMGTGEHPDRIIVDDPSKAGDARSEVALAAVSDWIDRTLSTRVMRNPAIIVIMQRLHLSDLTGHLLAKGGWTLVRFPARYRGREVDKEGRETWTPDPRDHRTVPGELLWPEKWPEDKVRREENELGPFGAAGQLGQDPVPEGGGLFKRESFPVVEAAPATARRCRGWDIADTEGGGNWTVGARLAYDDTMGLIYIEHVERTQSGPGGVNALIRETAATDGKRVQIAEGSGSGKATIEARAKMLAGYDYKSMPETSATGDKVTRANAFRAQAEVGNVRLVRGPWNDAYLSVITSFPVGKYDDDVDATAHAYNRLVQGITEKRRATWGAPRTADPVKLEG